MKNFKCNFKCKQLHIDTKYSLNIHFILCRVTGVSIVKITENLIHDVINCHVGDTHIVITDAISFLFILQAGIRVAVLQVVWDGVGRVVYG